MDAKKTNGCDAIEISTQGIIKRVLSELNDNKDNLDAGPLVYLVYSIPMWSRFDMRNPDVTVDVVNEAIKTDLRGATVARVVMAWEFEELTIIDHNPTQDMLGKRSKSVGDSKTTSFRYLLFDIQDSDGTLKDLITYKITKEREFVLSQSQTAPKIPKRHRWFP